MKKRQNTFKELEALAMDIFKKDQTPQVARTIYNRDTKRHVPIYARPAKIYINLQDCIDKIRQQYSDHVDFVDTLSIEEIEQRGREALEVQKIMEFHSGIRYHGC